MKQQGKQNHNLKRERPEKTFLWGVLQIAEKRIEMKGKVE